MTQWLKRQDVVRRETNVALTKLGTASEQPWSSVLPVSTICPPSQRQPHARACNTPQGLRACSDTQSRNHSQPRTQASLAQNAPRQRAAQWHPWSAPNIIRACRGTQSLSARFASPSVAVGYTLAPERPPGSAQPRSSPATYKVGHCRACMATRRPRRLGPANPPPPPYRCLHRALCCLHGAGHELRV